MRKVIAAVLFLVFGVSNSFADDFAVASTAEQPKVRPYKFSLGLDFAAVPLFPLQGSASFFYNPNKSIGSLGLLVGRYDSTRKLNGADVALSGYDAAVTIGYWSNDDKEKAVGWHSYFGIGMSSVASRNSVWKVENYPVPLKIFSLGADYFFKLADVPFALVLEGLITQRNAILNSGNARKVFDKDLFHLDLANDSRLQVGVRTWF